MSASQADEQHDLSLRLFSQVTLGCVKLAKVGGMVKAEIFLPEFSKAVRETRG